MELALTELDREGATRDWQYPKHNGKMPKGVFGGSTEVGHPRKGIVSLHI
jgi:hypothetical protein